MRVCRDCQAEWDEWEAAGGASAGAVAPKTSGKRPAPHPGPRCATHHREFKKVSKARAHEARVQKVYGLGEGDYQRLYELQEGRCALCQRATGARKRLAVDHDHESGLAYGLLCGVCNKDIMGWSRRDVAYFVRCLQYLENPPARQLGIVAIHEEKRKEEG